MEKSSEGPVAITRAVIDAAWRRRRPGFRLTIRDVDCRGLALVVNPTGLSWMLSYRPRGLDPRTGARPAMREVRLGTPAVLSPEQARAEGHAMKEAARTGGDPARDRMVTSAPRRGVSTVSCLLRDYVAALPSRPKLRGFGVLTPAAADDEARNLRLALDAMGVTGLPVVRLGAEHIRWLLRREAARPATARRRFGAVSRFLDWCRERRLVAHNPCGDVPKGHRPPPSPPRTHRLHLSRIATLWTAAGRLVGDPEEGDVRDVRRDLIRFLIAVPCRRNEGACLDWSHLDMQAGVWTKALRATGNGRSHSIPLPYLAHVIVLTRWETAGRPETGLVFPSPRAGGAVTTWSDMKAALDDASGITGWRWQDLRRSFAAALADDGVAETAVDGLLGIRPRGISRPEQDAAMRRWNDLLTSAIDAYRM